MARVLGEILKRKATVTERPRPRSQTSVVDSPPAQAASPSNDIAGAARIAPLFLLKWKSNDDLIAAARAQTSFTHGDPAVVEAAEFFARVTLAVQEGVAIPDALRAAAPTHRMERHSG